MGLKDPGRLLDVIPGGRVVKHSHMCGAGDWLTTVEEATEEARIEVVKSSPMEMAEESSTAEIVREPST